MKRALLLFLLYANLAACKNKTGPFQYIAPFCQGYLRLDSLGMQEVNVGTFEVFEETASFIAFKKIKGEVSPEDNGVYVFVDLKRKQIIDSFANKYGIYSNMVTSLYKREFCFNQVTALPSYYSYNLDKKKITFVDHADLKEKSDLIGQPFVKNGNQLFLAGYPYGIYAIDETSNSLFPDSAQDLILGKYSTVSFPVRPDVNFICGFKSGSKKDSVQGFCIDSNNKVLWKAAFLEDNALSSIFRIFTTNSSYVFVNGNELSARTKAEGKLIWHRKVDDIKQAIILDSALLVLRIDDKKMNQQEAVIEKYSFLTGNKQADIHLNNFNVAKGYGICRLSNSVLVSGGGYLHGFEQHALKQLFQVKVEDEFSMQQVYDRYTGKSYVLMLNTLLW